MDVADFAMGFQNKLRKQLTKAPASQKLPPKPLAWNDLNSMIMLVKIMAEKET